MSNLTRAQLDRVKASLGLSPSTDDATTRRAAALAVELAEARRAAAASDPTFATRVGASRAEEVRASAVYLDWVGGKPMKTAGQQAIDETTEQVRASTAYKNWR
jgi:hypothetical protein